jgi:phage baseplate assembly protein W
VTPPITGFAFPFQIETGSDAKCQIKRQTDDDKLRANLVHILLTNVGERVMRRGYGGGLRALLQDPNNEALWAIVQHQITKSLGALEPRVLVQAVTLAQADRGGTLSITLRYMIRTTQQTEVLSVPIGGL